MSLALTDRRIHLLEIIRCKVRSSGPIGNLYQQLLQDLRSRLLVVPLHVQVKGKVGEAYVSHELTEYVEAGHVYRVGYYAQEVFCPDPWAVQPVLIHISDVEQILEDL